MDNEAFIGIAILVGIVAVIAAIAFFAIRAERRLQAALHELAESRGWHYRADTARGFGQRRAGKSFTITPDSASDGWTLEVARRSSSRGGSRSGRKGLSTTVTNPGRAEFRAPEPAFRGGLAVFTTGATGAAMGHGHGAAAESLMGLFDNRIGKAVLGHVMGSDVGEHVGQLKSFPAPAGSKLTVMATADPSMFFHLKAIDDALAGWKPARGFIKSSPQLFVSEAGMRLFLNQQVTDPESVARLIDLGLDLRDRVMRAG